jgi:tRNA G46 methylase TrmB
MSDDRQYAPATLRNRDFILDVLRDVLPMTGAILEIASGSGEHIVHFARNFPALVFQPSDPEPDALLSVAAWVKATHVTNVRAPIALDASHSVWQSHRLTGSSASTWSAFQPWE